MNTFGASLLWGVFQVTLFTLAGLAVYLVARRRGPAAGSLAAAACLLMAVGVSALALSPWPHWFTLALADRAADDSAAPSGPSGAAADSSSVEPTNSAAANAKKPGVASLSRTEQAAAAWQAFWQELGRAPQQSGAENEAEGGRRTGSPSYAAAARWPAVVGAVFVAGLVLALVRLTLGLVAVRRLRANTRPIADARLAALAAELCARLKCTRRIGLRESLQLTSPATVGWRRPLVILPSDWRAWTAEERRVVLAHEIAHVGRGDYVTGLLGQFSLALHFYHPLVHWLARRLRLELELAADALGAEVSGGREAYLFILAQMALRQDDRAIAWAARPFLPSRGAFLRRIDMLRDPRQFRAAAMSRGRQFAIVSLVVAVGLLFAGLRGPAGQSLAQQPKGPPKPVRPGAVAATPVAEASAVDWSFVPANAAAVAIIRPAAMLSRAEMQPLVKLLNEQVGVEKQLGLPVAEIEELQLILPSFPNPGEPPTGAAPGIFMVRAKQAHDWKAFGDKAAGEPEAASFLGKNYVKPAATSPRNSSYYLPDDRTIVLASEPQLQRVLALGKTSPGKPDWAAQWPAGEAVAMVNASAFNTALGAEMKRAPPPVALINSFSPIWEESERLFLNLNVSDGLQLAIAAQCGSPQAAEKVNKTIEAAMTLASNALGQLADSVAAAPNRAKEAGLILVLSDLGTTLLKQAELKTDGNTVRWQSKVDLDVADTAVAMLAPAVMAARNAAQIAQSQNNMKQLMLAMHNYHDVNGHFPAAVVIGPDGKTPHSWRIEVLPYLEQNALYQQYKMDEPWDSDNNKKVLEKMPVVFRHPKAANTKDASYFALTGETTLFSDNKGTNFAQVTDGTSNTIALVEAQREIPWTKPEDIPYDPAKPLPKLGGFEPGIFTAAIADGSVRNLQQNIDEKLLRALITKAGGEPANIPNN